MVDFKKIISESNLYNFHSHTQFCDGRATMEEFIVEAIEEGFTDYGFSPHSPIPFETSCNMSKTDALSYLSEYNRLKEKYGKRIRLYFSMEIDYINDDWGPSAEYFDSFPFDYKIGSVHFIPPFSNHDEYVDIDGQFESFKEKMQTYFNEDIESVVRSYYRQAIDMIEHGGFDIIGHFDKIGHNASLFQTGIEDERWYENLVKEEFDAIMDNHLIFEINTKALSEHNRTFPNERYYSWFEKYDAPILINSDAHFPKLINAGRLETIEKLSKMGIYSPAKQ